MGKTRNLFKKIGDIKGNFHASLGMIKDRKNKDLTEAEEIEKRSQEQTRELYKKDLNDADNHNGVVTHLEPDILECEVKWVLEIITMGFPCGSAGKESACNWGGPGFDPWVGKISWRRERLPTPVFWPGEFPHDSVHGVTESWT